MREYVLVFTLWKVFICISSVESPEIFLDNKDYDKEELGEFEIEEVFTDLLIFRFN